MTKTLAAIDCGTNSIRLLIAEVDMTTRAIVSEIARENTIVRLGQDIDATGKFAADALERVDKALGAYTRQMQDAGVEDVMMVATSATRDASNKQEFFDLTAEHLGQIAPGLRAEVISGNTEAALSFSGAVQDLSAAPDEKICVIDLGGGSTEFIVGTTDLDAKHQAYSANMGCVRITERFLHDDPPSLTQLQQASEFVDDMMGTVNENVDLATVDRVVGVAGTMTTFAALLLGLDKYDPERIHMSEFQLQDFSDLAEKIMHQTVSQRLESPVMHPGRADVIGGGACVVKAFTQQFMDQGLTTLTISEKDILDGILSAVIARNDD